MGLFGDGMDWINICGKWIGNRVRGFRESTLLRRLFSPSAAWDVLIASTISLIPLFASGMVELRMATSDKEILATLTRPMGGGQLFLYGFSILATVFLLVNDLDNRALRRFVLPLTIALMVIVGVYIGSNPNNASVSNRQLVATSYYFYGVCLVFHYLAISFSRTLPPTVESILDTGVNRLEREVDKLEKQGA